MSKNAQHESKPTKPKGSSADRATKPSATSTSKPGRGAPSADGPALASSSEGGANAFQAVLEYLRWCFEVEEENARRHAETTKTLVATMFGVVIIGVFRFGLGLFEQQRLSPTWQEIEFAVLFAALVCFILAAKSLLWGRPLLFRALGVVWKWLLGKLPGRNVRSPEPERVEGSDLPASSYLHLKPSDLVKLPEPKKQSADYYRFIGIERSAAGVNALYKQNARRYEEIRRARQWFVVGFGLLFVALFLYTLAPEREPTAASPSTDPSHHGENNDAEPEADESHSDDKRQSEPSPADQGVRGGDQGAARANPGISAGNSNRNEDPPSSSRTSGVPGNPDPAKGSPPDR